MVGFFSGSMSTFGGEGSSAEKHHEKACKESMKLGHFESPGMCVCVLDGFDIYCIYIYIWDSSKADYY